MRITAILPLALLAAACNMGGRDEPAPQITSARADVRDANGRSVGDVTLRQTPSGVLVVGQLSGVTPGVHGIHFHAVGRCEPPFESAGGHFDVGERQHGFQNPNGPHHGDLPNIFVPESGTLRFETISSRLSLGGAQGLLDADGAAIVVHAYADDYQTDPSGNSGARIACGVITR